MNFRTYMYITLLSCIYMWLSIGNITTASQHDTHPSDIEKFVIFLQTSIDNKGLEYALGLEEQLDVFSQKITDDAKKKNLKYIQDIVSQKIETLKRKGSTSTDSLTSSETSTALVLNILEQETSKRIALTFDDGPHPINTPRLLDILAEKGAKATFYVNGWKVKKYPDIARRIVNEGHEIANHSRNHPLFTNISMANIERQVYNTNKIIFDTTGYWPQTMRPPYGGHNYRVRQAIDMPIVNRSLDTRDRRVKNAHKVYTYITNNAYDGAIVLMHETHKTTVDAMYDTITTLQKNGYSLETSYELLGFESQAYIPGKVYLDKWKQ